MPYETRRSGWALALVLCATPAFAQSPARPANEAIGSWVLACPPDTAEPCLLRYRDWVVAPANGSPSAALEVQTRGDALVPVIAVRGLSASMAIGGAALAKPTVTMGFDGGKRVDLRCGLSGTNYACAPDAAAVPSFAAALPKAHTISASVTLTIPGVIALPGQDRTLTLTGTDAALTRLRTVGATGEALPALPGLDLQGFLDRILRDLGFPNGAADVLPQLLPLLAWFRS